MGDAGLTRPPRSSVIHTAAWPATAAEHSQQGSDEGRPLGQLRGSLVAKERCRKRVWADRFEIEIAYTIGIAHPESVSIETFGTGHVPTR